MKRLTKRRIRRVISRNFIIIFLLVLLPAFLLMATGYSLLKSEGIVDGETSIVVPEPPKDNIVTDGDASIELGDSETGIRVVKVLEEEHTWGGTANVYKLTLYNDTDSPITSFRGIIKYKNANFSYGSYITSFDDAAGIANVYCDWMTIPVGGSITLDFVIMTTQDGYYPDIVIVGVNS